jgi:transcriptional regulator with PAS, ATPase and Fis domain
VQQVAEAIALAVGVEVEIVDNEHTIIGGTSVYVTRIGEKEEAGEIDGNYLYARVLRTGTTEYISDAQNDQTYGINVDEFGSFELAEICTPIKAEDEIIGIIGLVALNEDQRTILLDKNKNMVAFVEKMADLLGAKSVQKRALNKVELSMSEMSTVLETAHEGIFAIDSRGYIRHSNYKAAELFKNDERRYHRGAISQFMRALRLGGAADRADILRTKRYTATKEKLPLHRDAKAVFYGRYRGRLVISFRDIEEAQKLVYNINTRALKYTFDDIIGKRAVRRAKKTRASHLREAILPY